MPTDEERREVAARLRRIIGKCKYYYPLCLLYNEIIGRNCEAVGRGVAECNNECFDSLLARLADLIESESERTCHIIEQVETGPTSSGKVHRCSACGKPLPGWLFKERRVISYCFKCGARVVVE